MTTDELIARAEASLEGVTQGPWKSASQGGDSTILAPTLPPRNERRSEVGYGYRDENGFCVGYPFLDCKNETRMDFVCFGHADAKFIAASRQLVPDLIAALIAAEAHAKAGWHLASHWQSRYDEYANAYDATMRTLIAAEARAERAEALIAAAYRDAARRIALHIELKACLADQWPPSTLDKIRELEGVLSAADPKPRAAPAADLPPVWLMNCCQCGRVVDTREVSEGSDPHGCQVSDGRWTCSTACWEAATDALKGGA